MTENRYEYVGRPRHGDIVGRSSQSAWEKAESNRVQLIRLMQRPDNQLKGIIGVVGVGDGTSIDLHGLLRRFHEVHLIDVDEATIVQAIENQNVNNRARIRYHVTDFSGIRQPLEQLKSTKQAANQIQAVDERIKNHSNDDLGIPKFDVLYSLYQLSELTALATQAFADHPEHLEALASMVVQLRHRQIELFLDQLSPGGMGFMVVDMVSSKMMPQLAAAPEDLNVLLAQAFEQRRFYPGMMPLTVQQSIEYYDARLHQAGMSRAWIRQTETEHRACMAWRMDLK